MVVLEFEVRANEPVAVGLDGEALVIAPPLLFVSLPGALRVRLPRHATGVSPAGAAVTLTRRNLWALLRIAAGKPTVAPSQRSHPHVIDRTKASKTGQG